MAEGVRDTVVVGCDGSYESECAVAKGAAEAARKGAPLVLLAVLGERELAAERLSDVARREAEARARADAVLRRAVDRVAVVAPGLAPRRVVGSLDARAVKELAARACLLVLGRHGRGGLRALTLGSVSDELVRAFPVPVYIPRDTAPAPDRPDRPGRGPKVVVGVDGRGGEEELLTVAADEARARGAGLVIVRAVRPGADGDALSRPHVWDETWMAVHQVERRADVSSRVVVSVDEPVAALLDECDPDDVLVVGTRGQGRLAGLVRDSVARGVIDAGVVDVIVVPPGAQVNGFSAEVA